MKNQKGSAVLWAIVIIALLVIAGGIYFYSKNIPVPIPNISVNLKSSTSSSATGTNPTAVIPTSNAVSGMTQYTDSNFGFSFWYPSSWQVTTGTSQDFGVAIKDGTIVKKLDIVGPNGIAVLEEVYSPTMTITDTGGAGPFGPITYFFDPTLHEWMMTGDRGRPIATTTANVSTNTMGGLHMLQGSSRFDSTIIPLSAENFLIINDGGGYSAIPLAKTILATDPSVATPVSQAEQTQTIQAEANAYAGWQTYSSDGLSFQYPPDNGNRNASMISANVISSLGGPAIDGNGCYVSALARGDSQQGGTPDSSVVLNNIAFCVSDFSSPGAGNYKDDTYYTTYRNGNYITLDYQWGGAYNCDPSFVSDPQQCLQSVKDDTNNLKNMIQQSVSTLTFTNQ